MSWDPPNCKACGTPMVRADGRQDDDDWHGVCPNDACITDGARMLVLIPQSSPSHPDHA